MDKPEYLVVKNGTMITPVQGVPDGVLIIKDGKITDIGPRAAVPENARVIDADGNYIIPGMIDIHVHGSKGGDVINATKKDLETMSTFFTSCGVTAFLATALTVPDDTFLAVLKSIRNIVQNDPVSGAQLLGVHLEGPFLNAKQKGCHPPELLGPPDPQRYEKFLEYSDIIKMMTLAPELPGAPELVTALTAKNIVAAAGHSHGIYRELIPAIDAGISHAVHCFCNMGNFRRDNLKRVAGAAETFLYDDRLTTELICDGWHVGDTLMKLTVKVKGPGKVCLVTDAMAAAGMPPGVYTIGGVEAIVDKGIARLPDNSAYASSVTTMDTCLRNAVKLIALDLKDAVRMATLTPAEVIGVNDRKGSLEKGKDADLVIIDKNHKVITTIANGTVVYTNLRHNKQYC